MARVLLFNVGFLILALVFLAKMFDFWINLLVVVVIAALCEEMLFRGMIPKVYWGWDLLTHFIRVASFSYVAYALCIRQK